MIDAMFGRQRPARKDIGRERQGVVEDMATRQGDSARVRPDELEGYGPSATWA